jgi:TetR/AcrR family transcriptional repressor of nem operon
MRYPAHQTAERHQKILEEASQLFRSKGFAAASIGDVMKAAGLTHGGFYAHFDSKDALARASLEHAMEQKLEEILHMAEHEENPKAAFLSNYLSKSHRDHPEAGCAMAALAMDIAREPALKPNFTARLKLMMTTIAQRLPWKRGRSKEHQAMYFTAAIVGALVLARAVDDPELSDAILTSVQEELLAG